MSCADEADADAFDRKRRAVLVEHDRAEIGVFRSEFDPRPPLMPALDCDVVAEPYDGDLTVADLGTATDGEQITFQDAGVAHAQPAHFQQVVRAGLPERGSDCPLQRDRSVEG